MDYLQVAIAAAREAGRIQMNHFGHSHPMEYKEEFNPVTLVDKLCEEAIVKKILSAFPDHDILSEETPFRDKGSPWRWIIDPLDGTTNYSHGFSFFSVSIALEIEGEVRAGVVYYPVVNELFAAEKEKGAFLNGNQISVSAVDRLESAFLCTGFPYDLRKRVDFYLGYFRQFLTRSFAIRRPGSAAIDLCYVAAGRFDGFWELQLHPWDVAAGSLMITEAGGKVTDFQGHPFNIYSREILASNGRIHSAMVAAMREIDQSR